MKIIAMKKSILLMLILYIMSNTVWAKENNGNTKISIPKIVVCNIVTQASGPVAQAIATLVIIITGYSFFVGKVSIGMLFIVAAGVMFVFGAQTILGWIIGDSNFKCKGGQINEAA